jgi:hypothetical protein
VLRALCQRSFIVHRVRGPVSFRAWAASAILGLMATTIILAAFIVFFVLGLGAWIKSNRRSTDSGHDRAADREERWYPLR